MLPDSLATVAAQLLRGEEQHVLRLRRLRRLCTVVLVAQGVLAAVLLGVDLASYQTGTLPFRMLIAHVMFATSTLGCWAYTTQVYRRARSKHEHAVAAWSRALQLSRLKHP